MSDTPRNDAAQSTIWNAYENRWQTAQEAMRFARQLERENKTLRDLLMEAQNTVDGC